MRSLFSQLEMLFDVIRRKWAFKRDPFSVIKDVTDWKLNLISFFSCFICKLVLLSYKINCDVSWTSLEKMWDEKKTSRKS